MISRRGFMVFSLATMASTAFSEEEEIGKRITSIPKYDSKTEILTLEKFPILESKVEISIIEENGKTVYDFNTIYFGETLENLKKDYEEGIKMKRDYPLKGLETSLEKENKFEIFTRYPIDIAFGLAATYQILKNLHENTIITPLEVKSLGREA